MSTCTFFDFLEVLKPWIDRDYIRKGFLGQDGTFRIYFTDGGEKTYPINDCSAERIEAAFDLMVAAGIPVEKSGQRLETNRRPLGKTDRPAPEKGR